MFFKFSQVTTIEHKPTLLFGYLLLRCYRSIRISFIINHFRGDNVITRINTDE